MAKAKQVFFRGHSWPGVRAEWAPTPPARGGGGFGADVQAPLRDRDWSGPSYAVLTTTGRGREWKTDRVQAFWRSFAELNHQLEKDVLGFAGRRGYPFDRLPAPSDTLRWARLQRGLKTIAAAWGAPDADGVSHITDDPKRLAEIRAGIADRDHGPLGVIAADIDPATGFLQYRPETLAQYMITSALLMWQERTPMKRCTVCRDWMPFVDKRAMYCSESCKQSGNSISRTKES